MRIVHPRPDTDDNKCLERTTNAVHEINTEIPLIQRFQENRPPVAAVNVRKREIDVEERAVFQLSNQPRINDYRSNRIIIMFDSPSLRGTRWQKGRGTACNNRRMLTIDSHCEPCETHEKLLGDWQRNQE